MTMTNRRGALACVLLAFSAGAAAGDFGIDYDVERVPAARLPVASCAAAVKRGADAVGYVTRTQQDQGKLAMHVSGPRGDGKALVAYCIEAGTMTVWVVQALDYAGPGGDASAKVRQRVADELRRAAGLKT